MDLIPGPITLFLEATGYGKKPIDGPDGNLANYYKICDEIAFDFWKFKWL